MYSFSDRLGRGELSKDYVLNHCRNDKFVLKKVSFKDFKDCFLLFTKTINWLSTYPVHTSVHSAGLTG